MAETTVQHGCDQVGTTAQRPASAPDGFMFFDKTLGKPIWRDAANSRWVYSDGTVVV